MNFIIKTLGCKVNTYESSVMRDLLINNGYKEALLDDKVDIAIINTCTVTNTSDSKSLKMIKSIINQYPGCILLVTGCFSQVNHDLLKEMDGVSIVLGSHDKSKIVEYIEDYKKENRKIYNIYDIDGVPFEEMKLNNEDKTRAFVKIEDGCENFCSYCIIPYSRGKVRSKKKEDVIKEVIDLVNSGHKEVVLTGIHTGHYGADLNDYDFSDLLIELCNINELETIRISSIEITELNDKFLEVFKNNKKIASHLHIPLQSGANKTLKEMNRKYDKQYFIDKINKIRSIRKDISITTDLIVGFPGETEEDFLETCNTLELVKFSKIHVFPFSVRKGTKAELMENQISEQIKKQRVKKILEISKKLEIEYMNKFIGKEVTFISENYYKDNCLIGHTDNYLLVKVPSTKKEIHKKIKCKLESVNYPYVIGTLFDTK